MRCDIIKNKKMIVYALIVLFILLIYVVGFTREPGEIVRISENNSLIAVLNLNDDGAEVILDGNVIKIKENSVYMEHANCPDEKCKKQGAISRVGDSIICLPNRVIVEVCKE